MTAIHIKLKPRLFDLFQHCELWCTAGCCGWDAFDLSEHWLHRWCEFRDADQIAAALSEITGLRSDLAGREPDAVVDLDPFFHPSVQSVCDHFDNIEAALMAYSERTST